jgi:hypothetical protein
MFSTPAALDWIWWVGGSIFALVGIALFIRGFIGDRSRGRARCAKCWYDMSARATPTENSIDQPAAATPAAATCPECGWTARRPADLFKSRRRPLPFVISAILATIGLISVAVPKAQQDGLASFLPGAVLVRLPLQPVPLARDLIHNLYMSNALSKEVAERVRLGHLTNAQEAALARRLATSLSNRGLLGCAQANRSMYESLSARAAMLPGAPGVMSLKEAAAMISAAIGVQVELDEPDLAASNVLPTTPVNLERVRSGDAISVLNNFAAALNDSVGTFGFSWIVSGDHIAITAAEPKRYLFITLPTHVPAPTPAAGTSPFRYANVEPWIDMITSTIAPDTWQHNGGIDAHLVPISDGLLIEAPERTILGVERLFAMLSSSETAVEPPRLAALRERRRSLESKQLSIDFSAEIMVRDAIAVISAASRVPIRIDESSISQMVAAGEPGLNQRIQPLPPGTDNSVLAMLDHVLKDSGAAWVFDPAGPGLIIDSPAFASDNTLLAVYRFPRVTEARMQWALRGQGPPPGPSLNDPPLSVESIIREIEISFLPETWTSTGGEIGHSRVWTRDPPRFVITQIEPVHAKIYALLKKLEAAAASESAGQKIAEPTAEAPTAVRASTSPPGTPSGRR